jgi:hypothetical protein
MGLGLVGVLSLAVLIACWLASPAYADGVPVKIYLDYLPGISNWGPQTAGGTAVVAIADEYLTLDVQGLPVLSPGQHYGVWLQSRADRKYYAVGAFAVDGSGKAHFEVHNDGVPYQEYRMLLITVEPATGGGPGPSADYSVAGMIPIDTATVTASFDDAGLGTPGLDENGTPVPGSAVTISGPRPAYLPTTGGPAAKPGALDYAGGALLLVAAAGAFLRWHAVRQGGKA